MKWNKLKFISKESSLQRIPNTVEIGIATRIDVTVSLWKNFDVDISCLLSLIFGKFFSLLLQILLLGYETIGI